MTTIPTEQLATITGGAQGWLHPADDDEGESSHQGWLHPKEEAPSGGVHSAHEWVRPDTGIGCAGGFWHGCPSKKKEN